MVVTIPAKDEAHLQTSLESLRACDRPRKDVEVIVVVNTSEADSVETVERNEKFGREAGAWAAKHSEPHLRFHVLQCHGLKKKHAGVGLARKIAMDEACRRLEAVGMSTGIIACFDADSECAANYLIEVEKLFAQDSSCQACSIYFEHPLSGQMFDQAIYDAIAEYELHLRYYIHAQRYAGFPFASQTIGSSMAVRCDAYQDQNGMNKRKAGEDFYFLHKFTQLGHVRELNSTCVFPSPRPSHRVPFGTGKAVAERIHSGVRTTTYSPKSFQDLRVFFHSIDGLCCPFDQSHRTQYSSRLPTSVQRFLATTPFWERLDEIRSNVTSAEAFRTRFFRWFNAFTIMKFLHSAREHEHPDGDVNDSARWLLAVVTTKHASCFASDDTVDLLKQFRVLPLRRIVENVEFADGAIHKSPRRR